MSHFVILIRLTPRALDSVEETPGRLQELRSRLSDQGVELRSVYMTLGQYDAVAVVRAPDAEAAARAILSGARTWVLETETMRAFTEEEFAGLVEDLPG